MKLRPVAPGAVATVYFPPPSGRPHMDTVEGVAVPGVVAVLAWLALASATSAWNNPTMLVWYALSLLVFAAVMAADAVHGDPTGAET